MNRHRGGIWRLSVPWLMTSVAWGIQDPPAPPPEPAFRTRVELVQLSVIARDKRGKPVADLRREEFQIFDNGMPRDIRLFVPETAQLGAPPELKTANTFTNRVAALAGSHSGYSVILIDDLYSGSDPDDEEGSSLSRVRALQTLRSIPEGENIAIYAPGRKLRIICEFTSDRDLLERQLRKWKPTPTTPASATGPVRRLPSPELEQSVARAGAEAARIDEAQRATAGDFEMNLIADHLAGIPGRKNMIWLANKFPIGARALQSLNRAGVSIYPVDIDGVCRLCPPRPKQLMDGIAALTGGVAYYGRNDVDVAIREAMDDGRVSYTLGFYPASDDAPAQAHRLTVKSTRPGIELRYRSSYEPKTPPPASATTRADLVQALNRPIDATGIPIQASVTRTRDRLNLEATLTLESLDLVRDHDAWSGAIEVVARFTTADGIFASDAFAQNLTLNLSQTSYDTAVRTGFVYRNEFQIPAKAVELKLLFANTASGKIGTLTIPLPKIGSTAASTK